MGTQRLLKPRGLLGLALLLLAIAAPACAEPLLMGFYETWSERDAAPAETRFAALPTGIDIVALALAKPDMVFLGDDDLKRTGLEVPFGAKVFAEAIAAYRRKSPGTRVLLSMGGDAYKGWDRYAPKDAVRLVDALGLDGIDLDYEPLDPGCRPDPAHGIACDSDAIWRDLIRQTRALMPRPKLLTVQAWSIGAYGTGRYADAPPAGKHTGSMLWLARDPIAREIDVVAIMAYGAGRRFDPLEAFAAYRALWPGRLLIGERIGAEGGGGPPVTASRLRTHALEMQKDPLAGLMLYTLLPPGAHRPSRVSLDGPAAISIACKAWHRRECAGSR